MAEKAAAKEKPLEKMTVKDLREIAKEIPDIVGVHGMNKQDLIVAIKKARGIEDAPGKGKGTSLREIKAKLTGCKIKRREALASKDAKMARIYRRRVSRLKKKTRRAA